MDDCILHVGTIGSHGYGMVGSELAHRCVLRELHVPMAGLDVRHLCFNKLCVNPDHLTVGTRKQNMEDEDWREARRAYQARRHQAALLKPCPKCGGPRKSYFQGGYHRARCNKPGCY